MIDWRLFRTLVLTAVVLAVLYVVVSLVTVHL